MDRSNININDPHEEVKVKVSTRGGETKEETSVNSQAKRTLQEKTKPKTSSHKVSMDSVKKREKSSSLPKKEKSNGKERKSLKKELIDSLSEDDVKELILAKQSLEETREILREKEDILHEYEDLLKRKQAEFENFRKRVQREIEENKKYANVEIILDILTVLDDFERAINSAKISRDFDSFLEGIIMIEEQLRGILEKKYGVQRIEAVGKEFDPTLHDAVMMEESDKVEEDTVVEDFQKGYIMHDRIIRPSKVKVAKAIASNAENSSSDEFKSEQENNLNNNNSDLKEDNRSEKGE